jgi:hypothetical protein
MMSEQANESGENVLLTQSLTARAQDLGRSVDNWNTAYMVLVGLTVLLAAGVFIAQFVVINKSKQLSAIQSQLIADAGARAAEANEKAESERLARVKIEERLAGWKLGLEAQARLIERLKPFASTPFDLSVNPVETGFMETLNGVLVAAGWSRQEPKPSGTPPPGAVAIPLLIHDKASMITSAGISVEIAQERMKDFERAGAALVEGLTAEGIPAKAVKVGPDPNPDSIHVVIGSRE